MRNATEENGPARMDSVDSCRRAKALVGGTQVRTKKSPPLYEGSIQQRVGCQSLGLDQSTAVAWYHNRH